MSILLVAAKKDMSPFKKALLRADENLDIEIWPNVKEPERVQFAVAWNQPEHVFEAYPNLKAISSLGAGADHLAMDPTIPDHIVFTKAPEPSLVSQMNDYVHTTVLSIFLRFPDYRTSETWNPQPRYSRKEIKIGVMGLGSIGKETALYLSNRGFTVKGLSSSKKSLEDIETFSKDEMDDFLEEINILVNLLPLTDQTEGILNLDLFKKLREPSFLINVGRGEHLVDEDLIYALDTSAIQYAYLDVFAQEPLPDSHPFWSRDHIFITPHIASITDPDNLASLVVENYKRLLSGMELKNVVDRQKGY